MSEITVHPKQDQLLPPDPHLVLPPAVRKQIAAADAAHKQVFGDAVDPNKPLPLGTVTVEPEPPKPAAPAAVETQPAPVEPKPAPATTLTEPQPAPQGTITPEQWDHYTKSMQGRYKQQDGTIATLQDQLMQMGDEVQRLTAMVSRPVYGQPGQQPLQPEAAPKLITDKDVDTYGAELIDEARRAALEATAP